MKRLLPLLFGVVMMSQAFAAPPHRRVVLPNGLTLLAVEDRSSAVAGLHLGVRYDPASIPPEKMGVAALSQQLLQHELRELLKHEPWQELDQELRGTRGMLLLNTEVDYCEARANVGDRMLPQALQVVGKLLFGQGVPPEAAMQPAREALVGMEQSTGRSVIESNYYCFSRALYGNRAPLARPVEGTAETLAGLTPGDVAAFRRRNMGPNNAVLTIIAPRSLTDLTDLASLALEGHAAASKQVKLQSPPLLTRSRVAVSQQPGWRAVSLMVGVPAPAYGTREFIQAQLIYSLLDGDGGRVAQDPAFRGGLGLNRIAPQGQEPPSVTVLAPMAAPRPFLVMHMVMAPRQMEQGRCEMLKHFAVLRLEAPTDAELARARERLINSYARLWLMRYDFAKALGCYEIYGGEPELAWQAEQVIDATTGADLVALAKRYFEHHAIGLLMPGDE